jgi:MerR family transcriptional regulator/heat shock protein HspR
VRDDEPIYTMAVASRLAGMHPQTLRKYERSGLLTPARQAGNQRLYSEADLARLTRIRYLVEDRGLNLAGLAMALAMSDRLDAVDHDASHLELRTAIDEARGMSRAGPDPTAISRPPRRPRRRSEKEQS